MAERRLVGRAVVRGGPQAPEGEAWPWRARGGQGSAWAGPGPPAVTELDKADAWLLRKAHETGFLSCFEWLAGLLELG
uniref:Uncharacterized protein n=1 Tax=Sphaerodactylus townsendi TaxID=933632 RepID=A0ACB8FU90_9SAUR